MNCMKIALVIVACVAVTMASPCSQACNGACDLSKKQCDMAVVLGPVCGIAYGSCMQGCGNLCGCVDGCDASCTPAKETCQAAATNMIAQAQCVVEFDVCVVDCQAVCGITKTSEAASGLVQTGLGMVMGGRK